MFRFKERFQFVMKTGFETVALKMYGRRELEHEFEIASFLLKLPEYLVRLVDQRDHIE